MGLKSPQQGVKRTVNSSTTTDHTISGQLATNQPQSSSSKGGQTKALPEWMRMKRRKSGEEEKEKEKKGRAGFLSDISPSKHKNKERYVYCNAKSRAEES